MRRGGRRVSTTREGSGFEKDLPETMMVTRAKA
jgi:hypothetical protein